MQSNPYLPQFSYLVPSAICRHKTFHHTSHTTWSCRDVTTKIAQTLKSNLCWLTMPHKGLGAVDSPAPSVLGWVNGRRSAPLISNNAWHPLWRPIRRTNEGGTYRSYTTILMKVNFFSMIVTTNSSHLCYSKYRNHKLSYERLGPTSSVGRCVAVAR
jgi:hypothetical protein